MNKEKKHVLLLRIILNMYVCIVCMHMYVCIVMEKWQGDFKGHEVRGQVNVHNFFLDFYFEW